MRDLTEEEVEQFNNMSKIDQDMFILHRERRLDYELQGKKLAQQLADFVNAESSDAVQGFLDELTHKTHRTLQQGVFRLFCRLVLRWSQAKTEQRYDLRNEFTVESSQKFVKVLDGMLPPRRWSPCWASKFKPNGGKK